MFFFSRQPKALSFFPTESSTNILADSEENDDQELSQREINDVPTFKFLDDSRPAYNEPKQNFGFSSSSYNTGEYQNDNAVYNPNLINNPKPYRRPPQKNRPPPSRNEYAQYFSYQDSDNYPQQPSSYYPNKPPQTYQGNYQNYRPPPSYNQPHYAGTFNTYQTATGNPISNFLSNLGQGASDLFNGGRPQQTPPYNQQPIGPGGIGGGGLANNGPIEQFGSAIEKITLHDDLQCIPKIICQMVGSQRRQNTLTPLLGSPIFSS